MIKKTISIFLIVIMAFVTTYEVAYASTVQMDSSEVIVYEKDMDDYDIEEFRFDNKISVLDEMRGDSIPNQKRVLAGNPYCYHINNMYNHVYTDYYFEADSNGNIAVNFANLSSTGVPFTVNIYKLVFSIPVYVSGYSVTSSSTIGVNFPSLSNSYYYFIEFVNDSTSTPISGSGWIHHPGDSIS